MKKIVKVFLIITGLALILLLLYALVSFPPIMRGVAAKTMCSGVYASGRSPESVTGPAEIFISRHWLTVS